MAFASEISAFLLLALLIIIITVIIVIIVVCALHKQADHFIRRSRTSLQFY